MTSSAKDSKVTSSSTPEEGSSHTFPSPSPHSAPPTPNSTHRPTQPPRPSTQAPPTHSRVIFQRLLSSVVQNDRTLLPATCKITPITSDCLDRIAYVMWSSAFPQHPVFQLASQYSALMSHVKLRALAKMSFLPTWWVMREEAKLGLTAHGILIDDSRMDAAWNESFEWCRKALIRAGEVKEGGIDHEKNWRPE